MSRTKFLSLDEITEYFNDGDVIMVGGFGLVGAPLSLIDTLINSGKKELTIISNNLGEQGRGLGKLLLNGQVKKAIGSYFTSNPDAVKAATNGEIEVELLPQGTLSEAIRAGGAGIGAFYTPAGYGTELAVNKETRKIRDRYYVYQESLVADVSLVKAYKADETGNLIYRKSARNFNPMMATAGNIVIAEVEEIVPVGQMSPEEIITPNVYVDIVVQSVKGG